MAAAAVLPCVFGSDGMLLAAVSAVFLHVVMAALFSGNC